MTFRSKVKRLAYGKFNADSGHIEFELAYRQAYETVRERQRLRRENRAARKQGEATGTIHE